MGQHSYNNGLHTSSKGITVDAVRVGGLDVSAASDAFCTIEEDCKSGLVASVIHSATGVYDFQLSKPYPPKLVVCLPGIDSASGTTDLLHARYTQDSYDPDAGTFTITVSDDDDSGAPLLAAGEATDNLHVFLMFNRYSR
jgi:hypothetical protein